MRRFFVVLESGGKHTQYDLMRLPEYFLAIIAPKKKYSLPPLLYAQERATGETLKKTDPMFVTLSDAQEYLYTNINRYFKGKLCVREDIFVMAEVYLDDAVCDIKQFSRPPDTIYQLEEDLMIL
jgi:hypothetical protein